LWGRFICMTLPGQAFDNAVNQKQSSWGGKLVDSEDSANSLMEPPTEKRRSPDLLAEVLYTPDSELRRPLLMLRSMFADLLRSRELAWRLFVRDFSGQFRESILGYLWLLLPPLISMGVWVFLHSTKVFAFGDSTLPYPVFVLTGLVLWEAFVSAMVTPLTVVGGAASMLAKVNFPREALLMSAFAQAAFQTMIRLVLLAGVLFYYGVFPGSGVFLVPAGLLSLMLLGFVVGILLLPLAMLYGDVGRAIQVITPIWFFLTPAVYPPPTLWPASILTWANPVSPLLITCRQWLTGSEVTHLGAYIAITAGTMACLMAGWVSYRIAMPHIIARLST
jgi:lipopolysaccharide transport system permease protein